MECHWSILPGSTEGGSFASIRQAVAHARQYVAEKLRIKHMVYYDPESEMTLNIHEGAAAGMGRVLVSWTGKYKNFVKLDWFYLAGS